MTKQAQKPAKFFMDNVRGRAELACVDVDPCDCACALCRRRFWRYLGWELAMLSTWEAYEAEEDLIHLGDVAHMERADGRRTTFALQFDRRALPYRSYVTETLKLRQLNVVGEIGERKWSATTVSIESCADIVRAVLWMRVCEKQYARSYPGYRACELKKGGKDAS